MFVWLGLDSLRYVMCVEYTSENDPRSYEAN